MLHILFLTHWYPSARNPVEGIFIQEHARAVALNHQVSVIHVVGIQESPSRPEIPAPPHPLTVYPASYPRPALPKTAWLQRLRTVETIYTRLRAGPHPPDLIHAQVYSSADLALFLGRKYGLPVVLSEHASSYPRDLFSRAQAAKIRLLLNRVDLIMPVCAVLKTHMQRYGIHAPYEIVPNTIDTEIFYPAQTPPARRPGPHILQVAGLNPNKSIQDLLYAIQILAASIPDLKAVIVGDGSERARLEALAGELGIAGRVTFTGYQSKQQVAGWMRRSDCLALTSKWENQPVAVLEALACGLPVVAGRVGGLPELVNEQNGVLVEPGDPSALAQGLRQVLSSPGRYDPAAISQAAARQYSHSAVAAQFDGCYRRVLAGRRP